MAEADRDGACAPAGHARRGRATVWTAERLEAFLVHARAGGTLTAGLMAMGMSDRTLRQVRLRDPAFAAACAEIASGGARRRAAQGGGHEGAKDSEPPRRAMRNNGREKARFVRALAQVGGVETAARRLGVLTDTVYAIRDVDPFFAQSWRHARARWIETAETEMQARSVERFNALEEAPSPAAMKLVMQMAADVKAQLEVAVAADIAGAPTAAEEINLEAARMELEQRLCGLVERYGDPFGDDPDRPLKLTQDTAA